MRPTQDRRLQQSAQVKPERSGHRDLSLSERHRKWGLKLPAVDLDFILIEYDRGRPAAIVEYKSIFAGEQYPSHPSYMALSQLGDRANLPVFVVRYTPCFTEWRIIPLNVVAKKVVPERISVDERTFVTFLYQLRGLEPPAEIFKMLETAI